MHKLIAAQLQALGAPSQGRAQQIEDWRRGLLIGGTLRLECGLVELRAGEPIVTTLGDLRQCQPARAAASGGQRFLAEHRTAFSGQ